MTGLLIVFKLYISDFSNKGSFEKRASAYIFTELLKRTFTVQFTPVIYYLKSFPIISKIIEKVFFNQHSNILSLIF